MIETAVVKDSLWEGASEAFETMVMLPISEVGVDPAGAAGAETSLTGSLTFGGPLQGALLVQCDMDSAGAIARSMMMMEADEEIDEGEIKDAVGELANLVLGGLKSRIADITGEIEVSVPTVVKGCEVRPALGKDSVMVEIHAQGTGCNVKLAVGYREPKE
ncbi:MAG: chemotaxis protein CheX [Planctomycetes bacterium]|nr:chemotaxis protein CheX [Planctomycetota bacterium]